MRSASLSNIDFSASAHCFFQEKGIEAFVGLGAGKKSAKLHAKGLGRDRSDTLE